MKSPNEENRRELSYDGFGVNGPDVFRTRLVTFNKSTTEEDRKKYGRMFEASPELVQTLKAIEHAALFGTGRRDKQAALRHIAEIARKALSLVESPT